MFTRDSLYIGGEWRSGSGERLEVISPSTEQVVGSIPLPTEADFDQAVASARATFDAGEWSGLTVEERGRYLSRMIELLEPRLDEVARVQTDEMGAPLTFMRAVTEGFFRSVAIEIPRVAGIPTTEVRGRVIVKRHPVGVVAGIIPWNGPIALVFGRIIPALLTGCTLVIKPAPEAPLSAYLVAEAASEAGLPKGVMSILAAGREAGEYLISHPGVDRVSFTGSTAAGTRVAAVCGTHLKASTMELGGKSAAIIMEDCDLDAHMPALLDSSLGNSGQVCHATTRLLIPSSRGDEIRERLVEAVGALKVGDPHDPATQIGPLVSKRQRERVEAYIESGRSEGARVILGGGRPKDLPVGWYVEPTLFTDVTPNMRIAREEIFGPVLCLFEYDTIDEAIALANDSDFGLGGGVFTEDVERGIEVASRIQTGTCRINEGSAGGGGEPFGGVKRSGIGRERGREGYESYYSLQSIALPPGYEPVTTEALVAS